MSKDLVSAEQLSFDLVTFEDGKTALNFSLDSRHDTIWANQQQMSLLFGRDVRTISEHIRTIFKEGELDEATSIRKFRINIEDGRNIKVLHYNLDVILSVGYRVSSRKATKFRRWATGVLKSYILDGYALNESRLNDDPNALQNLAAQVRRLRAGEKQIYDAVRECFKIGSSDYDSKSKATRSFYAKLQDKFMYAITGKTAAEVVLERADHTQELMGLTATTSGAPTLHDAKVGKNYLFSNELYRLHILCEQFLLFAESRALQGQSMTMVEMASKFDELIAVQGHPVFQNYKEFLRDRAIEHARQELDRYKQKTFVAKQIKKERRAEKKSRPSAA